MPVTGHLAGAAVGAQGLDGAERHVVVGGPDALDLVAELGEPGVGLLERLGLDPVGDLDVEQLDFGFAASAWSRPRLRSMAGTFERMPPSATMPPSPPIALNSASAIALPFGTPLNETWAT
jgi:hypothetical protein